ncbi:MAG: hypothetical protein JSR46_03420, partial [Verrucomicrobia bacterium]|nr:hypothetical protein [Verrucomicrobiota bacterium]
ALAKNEEIEKIIEVKQSDPNPSHGLRYFHEKYRLPALQVVRHLKREKLEGEIEIIEAKNFLKSLFL